MWCRSFEVVRGLIPLIGKGKENFLCTHVCSIMGGGRLWHYCVLPFQGNGHSGDPQNAGHSGSPVVPPPDPGPAVEGAPPVVVVVVVVVLVVVTVPVQQAYGFLRMVGTRVCEKWMPTRTVQHGLGHFLLLIMPMNTIRPSGRNGKRLHRHSHLRLGQMDSNFNDWQ